MVSAVNYKRQYGQELNSSMAVVVQEMVSAESAGVMFTCDPVTSNPSAILITANYGLGESVVSAAADPDSFSLRRVGSEIELVAKSVSCPTFAAIRWSAAAVEIGAHWHRGTSHLIFPSAAPKIVW